MKIRVAGRYDTVLLGALTVAILFLFGSGIQHALDIAREVEVRLGIGLLPALVVLSAAFVFQQSMKRQAAHAEALVHAAAATEAENRARELEALNAFGRALSRALSVDALREALWRHLPPLVRMREIAVWSFDGGAWEELAGAGCVSRDTILRLADESAVSADAMKLDPEGAAWSLPLVVGERMVGLAAAPSSGDRWSRDARELVQAIGPLISIALRNVQLFRDLEKTAVVDTLTGCFTRAYGLEIIDIELRRARRTLSPLSVLMFDVDRFKAINDQHGHLAGDAVLAAVGRRLTQLVRRTDIRCRYGGDEFIVLLPDTPVEAATMVADNIARDIERLAIPVAGGDVHVTISVGVAPTECTERDPADVIRRADEALYAAKAAGRNCVRLAAASSDAPPAADGSAATPIRLVATA